MKKILSFILCLVMVLCSAVTVFATEATPPADGTVLYAKTFDGKSGSPKSLEEAGLEIFKSDESSFSAGVDSKTGLLQIKQTGNTYSNIVWSTDVLNTASSAYTSSYTIQITFRWVNIAHNTSGINVGLSGFNYADQDLTNNSPANIRGGKLASYQRIDGYGAINSDILSAWTPFTDSKGNNIPGTWTTVTIEAKDGKWGKITVDTLGAASLSYDAPDPDFATIKDFVSGTNPYLRFGYPLEIDIYDLRIVAGRDVADMNTPVLPGFGNVLYYQSFNNDSKATIENSELDVFEGSEALAKIDIDTDTDTNTGYLNVSNNNNSYQNVFTLPVDIPSTLTTYTLEIKQRYRTAPTDNRAGIQPSWWESSETQASRTSFLLKYNGSWADIAGNNQSATVDSSLITAWQPDTTNEKPGGWITMKIEIAGGYLSGASLMVEDSDGKQITWSQDFEWSTRIAYDGEMFLRSAYNVDAQIASIRVVEGVGYTAYTGDNATISKNGYEDPMINNVGIQKAINDNAVRLVGEIRGTDFNAAGFNMKIHYKDSEGNVKESSVDLAPEAVHTAYTSIKTGNGVATPSSLNYYFIVLEISEIPTDAEELTITFQPYAKSDSRDYTGETYEYDYVKKAFN